MRAAEGKGLRRGPPVSFTFNGEAVLAYSGETVAAALLASGHRTLRVTANTGEPRGLFCGMGTCFDCLVVIGGEPSVRACMTFVTEGMQVETQVGHGADEA